jgi:putative ABC transport system substrate-binding protein
LRRFDDWSKIAAVLRRQIRRTLTAATLALLLAATAEAQPTSKLPVIGILATGTQRTAAPYPALERALRDLGLVDGQNVRIEFRMAEGQMERLPGLAAELVRSNVDVLVAGGTLPSLEAARKASSVVPIVMIAVDFDPFATKFVSSLNRPGGNITGVFVRQIELTAKRMELLKEIVPKARRIAILSDDFTVDQLKMAESTARSFGLLLQPIEFRKLPYDYVAAFGSAAKERSGAALVTVGPIFWRDRVRVIEVARRQRIPTMFPLPEFADAGGLIAYGAKLEVTFASAAPYIDKILKGVKPADLPIEQPKSFELVVNKKTANAIGVTIPPSVLLRVDRVVE